jgi:hypothetical protein
MGFLDKVKAGAESAAAKAKEEAKELQTKREIGQTYDELGKVAYDLVERGEISHTELAAVADRIRALKAQLEELSGGGTVAAAAASPAGPAAPAEPSEPPAPSGPPAMPS